MKPIRHHHRSPLMNTRLIVSLAALPFLTSCSEEFLRSNSSPAYADGYKAGCENGTSTASNKTGEFVRDEKRYLAEDEYARGWRAGDRSCNGVGFNANPNDPMQPIDIDGPQSMGEYGH